MPFSLAVLQSESGPISVVEIGEAYYRLEDLLPDLVFRREHGLLDVLDRWHEIEPTIVRAIELSRHGRIAAQPTPDQSQFLAPILYPSKIICTGTNFYDHLKTDMKIFDFDKSKVDILFFIKHPHALVGPATSIRFPSQSREVDWEIELVVVFGKAGRRIPIEAAADYVAGYAIGVDLSARDWQMNPRHFKQFDLMAGKSFDDSAPLRPHIVPARYVAPTNLPMRLWVNGDLKQDSNTNQMIWSIPEQISQLSQHVTIEPGDVLYTGSPAGIGWVSKSFLKLGDRIEAEISGLGRLEIDLIQDPDSAAARLL